MNATKKPRGVVLTEREVRALRGDRLTLLVRPVKPQPHAGVRARVIVMHGDRPGDHWEDGHGRRLRCPLGAPGEQRFVRETWGVGSRPCPIEGWREGIEYRADDITKDPRDLLPLYPVTTPDGVDLDGYKCGWNSSSTMPAWASRDTIEIASVEVRRVQSVAEAEARACDFDASIVLPGDATSRIPAFGDEWARKYGADSWDRNDWAWFVGVRRVAEGSAA